MFIVKECRGGAWQNTILLASVFYGVLQKVTWKIIGTGAFSLSTRCNTQARTQSCVCVCMCPSPTYIQMDSLCIFPFFVFFSLFVPDVIFFQSFLFKLYQELCSYKESHLNLRFCIRMRTKIIDILLEDIYNTEESNLEKSRILIEKAKVLRAHGLERVKECMQCLEAAISTLVSPV